MVSLKADNLPNMQHILYLNGEGGLTAWQLQVNT